MTWRRAVLGLMSAAMVTGLTLAEAEDGVRAQDALQQVLADMVIGIVPPDPEGHCIELGAGVLNVTVQLIGEGAVYPVSFSFVGYRGSDPEATIESIVTRSPATHTAQLAGGFYCYSLRNETPVSADAGMATRTNFRQFVALRIVLTPQQ